MLLHFYLEIYQEMIWSVSTLHQEIIWSVNKIRDYEDYCPLFDLFANDNSLILRDIIATHFWNIIWYNTCTKNINSIF